MNLNNGDNNKSDLVLGSNLNMNFGIEFISSSVSSGTKGTTKSSTSLSTGSDAEGPMSLLFSGECTLILNTEAGMLDRSIEWANKMSCSDAVRV
nr:15289_t:CDS:2 [Entrophospora candida]